MSYYRMNGSRGRILPGGMDTELQRLPARAVGFALIAIAAIGWLSLLTWSIGDPSLNRATNGAPSNILGVAGASLADALLQAVGLASIALFLPPAIAGLTIASGDPVERLKQRIALWLLGVLLLASMLSLLPQPKGWLLTHGLGGVIGDFGQAVFLRVGGLVSGRFAGIIGAVLAGYIGLWALLRACGLALSDFRLLWRTSPIYGYPQQMFSENASEAFDFLRRLKHRVMRSLERETMERHDLGGHRRRSTNGALRNTQRRGAEGSFDPRFEGYEGDMRGYGSAAARRAAPASRAPAERPAPGRSRIEPFFESGQDFPAPQPTRLLPIQAGNAAAGAMEPAAGPYAPPRHHEPQPFPARQEQAAAPYSPAMAQSYPAQTGSAAHAYAPDRDAARSVYPAQAYAPEADEDDPAVVPFPQRERHTPSRQEDWDRHHALHAEARSGQAHRRRSALQIRPSVRSQEDYADFEMPSLKLLMPAPERRNNPELSDTALGRKAELLHGVLEDFGVKGTITGVHPGPVITLYELEPARGTKSSRVIGLADDIARSMSAVSARVAVIPGRDAIGIELPNQNREVVYLRELLEAPEFAKSKNALPLALGKTIGGAPVIVDLARMPHLLIAGTTGSGKSVGINAMILSLLYRLPPEQCRFIMIDPKMLELSVYDDIPHLLTPVVTDPKKAIAALKWTVSEMNARYERMCKLGVRNIGGFNQKVTRAKQIGRPLMRTVQTGFDEDSGQAIYEHEEIDDSPMPYIVVVIDEMADLMMVAGKEIEFTVQRLSQMARAAGIHLIMATQRPSVDVITGTIKANFPSRVSFQVTSKIDSRTILGEQGAEQLLGAGDMLTMAAGGRIMRAHGPFVSDEEVERIVGHLKEQGEPEYLDGVLDEDGPPADAKRGGGGAGEDSGRQPTGEDLYDQAVDIVLKDRRATTSYLQRRLGIGYNRAASLIERMEEDGLISAPNRTGKRDVLSGED